MKKKYRLNPSKTIRNLLTTNLRKLNEDKLLPESGILINLTCRSYSGKNMVFYACEESMKDSYSKSEPFLESTLDDVCSKFNCKTRIPGIDVEALDNQQAYFNKLKNSSTINDLTCKTNMKNCSKCNKENKCISCQNSDSVVLVGDGKMEEKCEVCFTLEELYTFIKNILKGECNLENINPDKDIAYCIEKYWIIDKNRIRNPIYSLCSFSITIIKAVLICIKWRDRRGT